MMRTENTRNKVWFYFEGGLGDVIAQFYKNERISSIDGQYVKLILNTHNPQSHELFRWDERFSEIHILPYQPNHLIEIARTMASLGFVTPSLALPRSTKPEIYCSRVDHNYLQQITPNEPYVLCQVGSGKHDDKYHEQCNLTQSILDRVSKFCESKNWKLVLVGGTSAHTEKLIQEPDLTIPRDVLDLRDICNPRLVCDLSRWCERFIGTFSCYVWAALAHNKKCTCFIPDDLMDGHCAVARQAGVKLVRMNDAAEYTFE